MSSTVFSIENGVFGLSLTDPDEDVTTAAIGDYTDFTCQVTSGALEAQPNSSTKDTPATWCSPASSEVIPGVTSYQLNFSFLQDPNVVDGINRFLFENDAELAYFFMGFDGTNPPRAIGKVRLVAGTIGGAARETLLFTVTMPVSGKPEVLFGDADESESVGGLTQVAVSGVVVTDAEVTAAADSTAKLVVINAKYVGTPVTAWTTGQSATIASFVCHWTGSAWAAGAAS